MAGAGAVTNSPRHATLVEWAKEQGATLHPYVEIARDDRYGFHLRARQHLVAGTAIFNCTLPMTLSYLNVLNGGNPLEESTGETSFSEKACPFPRSFLDHVPPHVVGRFFLIQQYLLGPRSPWHQYVRSLPQPEHITSWALPAVWPNDDLRPMYGTNAYYAAKEMKKNIKREYKQATEHLSGLQGHANYSRILYNWAWCIFTSRSFRPSVVIPHHEKLPLPAGVAIDDFSILLPVFDLANHAVDARVQWDVTSDPTSCRLRTQTAYRQGEQVYNSYGRKTNAELLVCYGFTVPAADTLHNDYVHLQKKPQGAGLEGDTGSLDVVGDQTGQPGAPRDFLVSLRPMHHPSSLVGRARQALLGAGGTRAHPALACLEASLVWDVARAVVTAAEREAVVGARTGTDEESMCLFLQKLAAEPSDGSEDQRRLLRTICRVVGSKLASDLDTIADEDEMVDVMEEGNDNQRLAVGYRDQCIEVLNNALGLLSSGLQLGEDQA